MTEEDILSQLRQNNEKSAASNPFVADAVKLSDYYLTLQREVDELSDKRTNLLSRLDQLKVGGAVSSQDIDTNQLNKKVIDLYRLKEAKDNEIKEITNQIKELSEKKIYLTKSLDDLTAEKVRLSESIAILGGKRTELEQRLDRLKQEIDETTTQFQKRASEVELLKTTVNEYKHQITESEKYIKEAKKNSAHKPLIHFHTSTNAHAGAIVGIEFNSSYDSIYTIGDDKKFIMWSLPSLTERSIINLESVPNSFRIYNESQLVSVPCNDKTTRIFDLTTGRKTSELKSHNDACTDCQWISRNQLVTTSKDRSVKVFDLTRNACIVTINAITALYSICPSYMPTVYVVGGSDGSLRIVDTREKKVTQKFEKINEKQITSLITPFSKDRVFSLGLDNYVCETDLRTGTRVKRLTHPALTVKSQFSRLSIDPCGGFIAAGSQNGSVLLFDLEQEQKVHELKKHTAPVLCSAFADNVLITADSSHTLAFWT